MKSQFLITMILFPALFSSGCNTVSSLRDVITIEWRCPTQYTSPRTFASLRPVNSQASRVVVPHKASPEPASKQTATLAPIPMVKVDTKPLPKQPRNTISTEPKTSQKTINPPSKRLESKLSPHSVHVISDYIESDNLKRIRDEIIQAYKEFRFDEVVSKSIVFVEHPISIPRQIAEVSILAGASLFIQGKEKQSIRWFKRAIQADPDVEPNDAVFPRPVCRLFQETAESMK